MNKLSNLKWSAAQAAAPQAVAPRWKHLWTKPKTKPQPVRPSAQDEVHVLEALPVLGSRLQGRSAQASPVPVDIIQGADLQTYGIRDMDSLLAATVPSYNVNQRAGDAAMLVRPANLRGLPPDSTLVLVNGKRRHRASVITFLGGGISDGAQGADISVIPSIALKRLEVLRDGSSSQYGSDAIAGVLNFVLRDDPEGAMLETRWGQNYHGDGDKVSVAGNIGLPLTGCRLCQLQLRVHEH